MIKRLDDIDKKRRKNEKEIVKKEIADDISDVVERSFNQIEDFFKRKRIEKDIVERRRNKWGIMIKRILVIVGVIGLVILILNFMLGNIWLLKTLIKSLFN